MSQDGAGVITYIDGIFVTKGRLEGMGDYLDLKHMIRESPDNELDIDSGIVITSLSFLGMEDE
tara:strand:- start:2618 stop:2806 length:189 start_codon:yes stop_codon:yes gene_type:complete